ncbi:MAG: winged helix-turn-helix domain-containing protein [Candidatus Acidiferrales bacterium]
MDTNSGRRLFRFGVYEAEVRTGELRKQGRRVPLQGQPLQVLLMLLEHPGELVPRAELHQRLWPDGTFVDFDHGLNTAINKIREALGDSASSPRFVETLARRGYRFIAPVEVVTGDSATAQPGSRSGTEAALHTPVVAEVSPTPLTARQESVPVDPATPFRSVSVKGGVDTPSRPQPDSSATVQSNESELTESAPRRGRTLLASPDELPRASRPVVRTLFLLLQVMYLGFYAVSLARLRIVEGVVAGMTTQTIWAIVLLIVTAAVGIPTRLYLISAAAFGAPGLRERYLKIFPVIFPLDELWALAPFLLTPWIGFGAALGSTAALLYAPFAQRSLILMGAGAAARPKQPVGS